MAIDISRDFGISGNFIYAAHYSKVVDIVLSSDLISVALLDDIKFNIFKNDTTQINIYQEDTWVSGTGFVTANDAYSIITLSANDASLYTLNERVTLKQTL